MKAKGKNSILLNFKTVFIISFFVISGIVLAGSIDIVSPSGAVKGTYYITWTSSLDVATVKLEYSPNGGSTWSEIVPSASAAFGYYAWDTSGLMTDGSDGQNLIKITGYDSGLSAVATATTDPFNLRNYEPVLLSPKATAVKWANDQYVSFLVENGANVSALSDIKIYLKKSGGSEYEVNSTYLTRDTSSSNPKLFKYKIDTKGATGNDVSGNGLYTLKAEVNNHSTSALKSVQTSVDIIDVQNIFITAPTNMSTWSGTQNLTWVGAAPATSFTAEFKLGTGTWTALSTGAVAGTMAVNTNLIPQTPDTVDTGDQNITIRLTARNNATGFIAVTESQQFKVKHRPVVDAATLKVYRFNGSDLDLVTSGAKGANIMVLEWQATDPDGVDNLQFKIEKDSDTTPFADWGNFSDKTLAAIKGDINTTGLFRDNNGTAGNLADDKYYYVFDSNRAGSGNYTFHVTARDKDDANSLTYEYTSQLKDKIDSYIDHKPVVSNVKIEEIVSPETDKVSGNNVNQKHVYFEVKQLDGVSTAFDAKMSYLIEYSVNGGTDWVSFNDFGGAYKSIADLGGSLARDGATTNYITGTGAKLRYSFIPNEISQSTNVKIRVTAKYVNTSPALIETSDIVASANTYIVDHTPVVSGVYTLTSGSAGTSQEATISGHSAKVKWTAVDPDSDTLKIDIYYSVDGSDPSILLTSNETNDGDYTFNSNVISQSANVKIKVVARDTGASPNSGGPYEKSLTTTAFAVSHTPVLSNVYVISTGSAGTSQESVISGHTAKVRWTTSDPDSDTVKVNIYYSTDGSDPSTLLAANRNGTDGEYTFDSNVIIESSTVKIKVVASDTGTDPNSGGPYVNPVTTTQFATVHKPVIGSWSAATGVTNIKTGALPEAWKSKNVDFTWSVSDPDADGVALKIEYSRTSNFDMPVLIKSEASPLTNTSWQWNTTDIEDGEYYVRVTVTDNSANTYSVSDSTAKFVIDNGNKPDVTVEQPSTVKLTKNNVTGYDSVNEVWGKSGAGSSRIFRFKIKNNDLRSYAAGEITYNLSYIYNSIETPIASIQNTSVVEAGGESAWIEYTWDISALTDGDYKVKVEAVTNNTALKAVGDNKNNAENLDQFTILNSYPKFTTSSAVKVKGQPYINISWTSTDPQSDTTSTYVLYKKHDIASWPANINSISGNTNDSGVVIKDYNQSEYNWNPISSVESDISYDVMIIVQDSGGNKRYAVKENAFVIRIKPLVTINTPAANDIWSGTKNIQWVTEDPNNAEINATSIEIYKGETDTGTPITTIPLTGDVKNGSQTINTQGYEEGKYTVKIVANVITGSRTIDSLATQGTATYGYTSANYTKVFEVKHKPVISVTNIPQQLSGDRIISWIATDPDSDTLKIDIEYTIDGVTWKPFKIKDGGNTTQVANTGSVTVDTRGIDDSTRVKVRFRADDATTYGGVTLRSDGVSYISKHTPDLNVLYPAAGAYLSGTKQFTWVASDPDGDIVKVNIQYSADKGETWNNLIDTPSENIGVANIDTKKIPNGNVIVKMSAVEQTEYSKKSEVTVTGLTSEHRPGSLRILTPNSASDRVLSGMKVFSWQVVDPDSDPLKINIEYSTDGKTWNYLKTFDGKETKELDNTVPSVIVNTKTIPDADNVTVRISAVDATQYGGTSDNQVTGIESRHKPTIMIYEPKAEIVYKRDIKMIWNVIDPDNDPIAKTEIYYSDDVKTDEPLNIAASGFSIPDEVLRNIKTATGTFKIKIKASDAEGNMTSGDVVVTLDRSPDLYMVAPLKDQIVKGNMTVKWRATNPNSKTGDLNGNMYMIVNYSVDGGGTWKRLYEASKVTNSAVDLKPTGDEYSYTFNTKTGILPESDRVAGYDKAGIPDSKIVKIKVTIIDRTNDKFTTTAETDLFTIANYVPVVRIKQQGRGVIWYGKRDIIWDATSSTGNPEDDKKIDIRITYAKYNDKNPDDKAWQVIERKTFNDGVYTWDTNKVGDGKYFVRVEGENSSGVGEDSLTEPVEINNSGIALNASEFYNFPNPFRSSTSFKYILPNDMLSVKIEIYTSQGQKLETISDLPNLAGMYRVPWVAHSYANGAYFARIVAKGYDGKEYVRTTKLAVMK